MSSAGSVGDNVHCNEHCRCTPEHSRKAPRSQQVIHHHPARGQRYQAEAENVQQDWQHEKRAPEINHVRLQLITSHGAFPAPAPLSQGAADTGRVFQWLSPSG